MFAHLSKYLNISIYGQFLVKLIINFANFKALRINQVNERQVLLGDRFSLSCVAVGSADLKFFWYKDNMLVNMSKATR